MVDIMDDLIRQVRREALKEAEKIADTRVKICLKAAAKYEKENPGDPYFAPSERCAAQEAAHIADLIRELAVKDDKR